MKLWTESETLPIISPQSSTTRTETKTHPLVIEEALFEIFGCVQPCTSWLHHLTRAGAMMNGLAWTMTICQIGQMYLSVDLVAGPWHRILYPYTST